MQPRFTGSLALFQILILCLVPWVSLTGAHGESGEPETKSLVHISTGDFSPWTDENATHGGFVNRVVREAFRRQGLSVEFSFWPWKRALVAARNGKVDATSFWYLSEEKSRDFYYSEPISEHREIFFYLKKRNLPPWKTLSDLSGLDIGATRGYTYTDEFWEMGKQGELTIFEANSDELNFKKLMAGRVDLFPAGEVVGWRVLEELDKNARDKISVLAKPLAEQHGHLLFPRESPASKALLKSFNDGLQSMRDDGTYQKYYQDMLQGIY